MSTSDWQICGRSYDRLGESVLWHPVEQALYWVDFYGPLVRRLKDGILKTWTIGVGKMIGSLVFADKGRLVLAVDQSLYLFDPNNGEAAFFAGLDHDEFGLNQPKLINVIDSHMLARDSCEKPVSTFSHPALKRGRDQVAYNDGKVDRAGRYWIGTYDMTETEPRAAFYRVSSDGVSTLADGGFVVCNGPTFSPDNRILYFSDSAGRRILAYDLDADGNISNRHVFKQFSADEGMPDGLAADSAGNIWCALYGAGNVVCLAPSGKMTLRLPVPVANVTSLCFGGPDLKNLYIATGRSSGTIEAAKDEHGGGCAFVRPVDCAGLPEPVFVTP